MYIPETSRNSCKNNPRVVAKIEVIYNPLSPELLNCKPEKNLLLYPPFYMLEEIAS